MLSSQHGCEILLLGMLSYGLALQHTSSGRGGGVLSVRDGHKTNCEVG